MSYEALLKEAQKTGAVKNLSPEYREFKREGETVVGKLINIVSVESGKATGYYNQYVLETDAGVIKFHMGQATDKEIQNAIHVQGIYAFTFVGKVDIGRGRTVNKFKVIELADAEPAKERVDTLEKS